MHLRRLIVTGILRAGFCFSHTKTTRLNFCCDLSGFPFLTLIRSLPDSKVSTYRPYHRIFLF